MYRRQIRTLDFETQKSQGCSRIEHVELADSRLMLMDEESKCRNDYIQRRNGRATTLYRGAGATPGDFVSGHVLICNSEEFR